MHGLTIGLVLTAGAAAIGAGQQPFARHAPAAPVVWATDSAAPCVGLTVTFEADSARVAAMLGARWTAAGARNGRTPVSLFVAGCPRSTIGGTATGPVTTAAVIVGVRPANGGPARAAAVPVVYGDSGDPVAELFRAFAFDVRGASLSMNTEFVGGGTRVRFSIVTPDGRLEATARAADTARTTATMNSRLVDTDPARASAFTGPEWRRRSAAAVAVRATGNTLLAQLGVTQMPTTALYDAGFGWRFTFRME